MTRVSAHHPSPATDQSAYADEPAPRNTGELVSFFDPSQPAGESLEVEDRDADGPVASAWEEPAPAYDGTLFGTEQLNADEVDRLVANRPCRLVVWLGEQASGKTTLGVELYERQRRGVPGVRFAGSWTLLALEQLAERRRRTGETEPAWREGLDPEGRDVLHLALSTGDIPLHLLIADLPGEVFRRLADNQLVADSIEWLTRADKLVLLVDGARLCDVALRSSSLTRVRQLLERLGRAGVLGPDKRIALLVTKWDLVRADAAAIRYWEQREPELLEDMRVFDRTAVALRAEAPAGAGSDGVVGLRDWLLEVGSAGAIYDAPAVHFSIHDAPAEHFPLHDTPGASGSVRAFQQFARPMVEPARRWRPWRRRR